MNEQSYAKAVAKRLACSKARRDEFVRDLESDIAASLADGETWEQVEARMGDPREVAREFNDGLSDRELASGKKRKRNKIIAVVAAVAVVVVAVLAAATWWVTPHETPAGQVAGVGEQGVFDRAQEAVSYMSERDYDALREMLPESLKGGLPDGLLDQAREEVGDGDWGAFVSFGNQYASEVTQSGQTVELVDLVAVYENSVVTYTITFNKDLEMTNFFVR